MSQILENPLPLSVDLEKEMTTHSSILTWRVPWTKEPGRLQSMGVAKSQKPLSDYHSLTECRLNLDASLFLSRRTQGATRQYYSSSMCQWKNVACLISKLKMLQRPAITWEATLTVSLEETQDGNRCPPSAPAATPSGAPWGDPGWESTACWPQTTEMHSKGMISDSPDSRIVPYIEKH